MRNTALKKIILVFSLLFSCILVLTACSGCVLGEQDSTHHTAPNSSQTLISSVETTERTMLVEPPMNYYEFPLSDYAIVEWGGDIAKVNVLYEDNSENIEYLAVGINYIRRFEKSYTSEREDLNDTRKYSLIDEDVREEMKQKYEDVILINSSAVSKITPGMITFIPEVTERLVSGERYSGKYAYAEFLTIWEYPEFIDVIQIIDDKFSIPEYWSEEGKTEGLLNYYFAYTNDMLEKAGLSDAVFRDGMTVEEFEEYFNLVTGSDTFAPIFEPQ